MALKVGEIHWVNLDPTIGDEIKKKRPVVVLNGGHEKHLSACNAQAGLKVAIVVPVTEAQPLWEGNPFFVILNPDAKNGLKKKSAVDSFQIRAISHKRFVGKMGEIPSSTMNAIKTSLALILDIDPEHC